MADETCTEVYRLHGWICRISPMIWRRLLVRSDSTIADLHYTLQTAFGWSDEHLHRFHIHGQELAPQRWGKRGILPIAQLVLFFSRMPYWMRKLQRIRYLPAGA
jgi:hypothetical protein